MYIERPKKKVGDKVHEQILLRESYRVREEWVSKLKKGMLLKLTRYDRRQLEAIELALKNPEAVGRAVEKLLNEQDRAPRTSADLRTQREEHPRPPLRRHARLPRSERARARLART